MPDLISLICPSCGGKVKLVLPRLAILILLVVFLSACNMPQGGITGTDTGTVATKVSLTLAALTQLAQQTPVVTPFSPTLEPPTNTLTPSQQPSETMGPMITQTITQLPTQTMNPTNTPIPAPGTIAGGIYGYPYGTVPALAIVASGKEPPYYFSWMITGAGETTFAMSSSYLIPGHYQVVAYDSSGHAGGCTDNVLVISNQTVNCDITDWGGGYPAKPPSVPSP